MGERGVPPHWGLLAFLTMTFFALAFGEFMTGGIVVTPLTPIGLLVLYPFVPLTYGLGALLVREVTLRWGKGWGTKLLLAGAYALVLQGLFTHVLFGPASSPDVGFYGTYGRWLGVNWGLVPLALYEDGIVAIGLGFFLTDELLPRIKGRAIVPRIALAPLLVGLAALLAWAYIYINSNNDLPPTVAFASTPPLPTLLLLATVIAALVLLAWRVRPDVLRPRTELPTVSPLWMTGLGLAAFGGMVLYGSVLTRRIPWPAVAILLYGALGLLLLGLTLRWVGEREGLAQRGALVLGAILPWAVFDLTLAAGGDLGALAVAGLMLLLILYVVRKGYLEGSRGRRGSGFVPAKPAQ